MFRFSSREIFWWIIVVLFAAIWIGLLLRMRHAGPVEIQNPFFGK